MEAIAKDSIQKINLKQEIADQSTVLLKDITFEMERMLKRPAKINWKYIYDMFFELSHKFRLLNGNKEDQVTVNIVKKKKKVWEIRIQLNNAHYNERNGLHLR